MSTALFRQLESPQAMDVQRELRKLERQWGKQAVQRALSELIAARSLARAQRKQRKAK